MTALGSSTRRVRLPVRARMAVGATRAANAVSRRLGLGEGTVAGGRLGLALDPALVARLGAGRAVVLVSGTNGKTTTTRLLAVALEAGGEGPVVSNATGSNMPAGHVAALATGRPGRPVVLEVDEGYLPDQVASLAPAVVVLLNLSRDQLDRTNEVRMLAGRWRAALGQAGGTVVANADDPLTVWGAGTAHAVRWVAAGLRWRADAVGCPACDGRITFDPGGDGRWACGCGFARPEPDVHLEWGAAGSDPDAVWRDGTRLPVSLTLPGAFNRANAVQAAVAAQVLAVAPADALAAMATVGGVAGRFTTSVIDGVPTRLLLAKNPAGWAELLGMVCPGTSPVVVGINARVADGRDPSWLWDVPFERLAGRPVVASGERARDLAVRLQYAEVPHVVEADPVAALHAGGGARLGGRVDYIGNYTAFHELMARR